MICPKCHLANSDDAQFCSQCGESIRAGADVPPANAHSGVPGMAGAAAGAAAGAGPDAWSGVGAQLPGLIERIKNILLSPKTEWPVIERESTSIVQLFTGYVVPLVAFAALMSFVRLSLMGVTTRFGDTFRMPLGDGITMLLVRLVAGLLGVFVVGFIINGLAPTFSAARDNRQALKIAAYAFTPAWLAALFVLLGGLGALLQLLAGLYGIYLLYLGLPTMMKCPQEKAVGYTAAVVVCTILLGVVFGILNRATGGFAGYASF